LHLAPYNDDELIHDLGLSGPILEACVSPELLKVRVQTSAETAFDVFPKRTDTIGDLKTEIKLSQGILPTCQQRIIFVGRQLPDEQMLHDNNIQDGSTAHLCVLRMRGGARCGAKRGISETADSEAGEISPLHFKLFLPSVKGYDVVSMRAANVSKKLKRKHWNCIART
jgi:hypothetical protein